MKINHYAHQVEMTKKEAKEASKYGTDTYKTLVEIKKDFPDFSIVVRDLTRKSNSKGFSYDKMEKYINAYGTEEQIHQFEEMRETAKDKVGSKENPYKYVKEWFIQTFPEASDFSAAMARIIAREAG